MDIMRCEPIPIFSREWEVSQKQSPSRKSRLDITGEERSNFFIDISSTKIVHMSFYQAIKLFTMLRDECVRELAASLNIPQLGQRVVKRLTI